MFRRHHQGRRPTNKVFVIFRLTLSLVMFVALLSGVYSAYKHFSGLDPLKLNPQAIISELLAGRIPEEVLGIFSSTKLTQGLSDQISQKVLPAGRQVAGLQNSKKIPTEENSQKEPAFKFLLLADSHGDNDNLSKAIDQARKDYSDLKFIIGLGDYSEVGTVDELKKAKRELDSSTLRYFLIPGDHDLWDCRNRSLLPTSCFGEVFGPDFQSFTFENFRFILINNSDNYKGIGQEQSEWIASELEKAVDDKVTGIFVFVHEPLYHPSSDHFMGRVEKELISQAKSLIFQLKTTGVKKVFSGDVHYFSEYEEPETKLPMVTVGAVGIERNPQAPRFTVVSVFEDGSTKVEDIEVK